MKRKRVVHITTVHPPFDTRIFYKECKSLAENGLDVFLIHTDSEDYEEQKFKMFNIEPVTIKRYNNRLKRVFFGVKNALDEAVKLKADIYHIHDPELLLIVSKLKRTGATVIYDVHEDYYTSIMQKEYIPKFFRIVISNLFTWYEKRKSKVTKVILAEEYYKNKFPKGIEVLNYPIIDQKNNRIAYSNNHKLLYTGNVTKDRGALIHARIPSYMNNIEVHFVGKCEGALANEMKQISKNPTNVKFKGINRYVPREEIDKEYLFQNWLAGLAIFPPTEHYFKKHLTKFFEYMYAGLPIIASNFPEWKKFINKYECGLTVDPNDEKTIKKAIEYLQTHPNKAKQMGVNGKNAILNKLNWDKEYQKLEKIYQSSIHI